MIPVSLPTVAYLGAGVLFILSLGGLSKQATARRGNLFGMVGMGIAIVATTLVAGVSEWGGPQWALVAGTIGIGASIGAVLATRVAMTGMPELVAQLHSFVGLAAVLVGISTWLQPGKEPVGAEAVVHLIEVWLGVAIGAVTFTGSIIAWGKLKGSISGKPLLLPGRHVLNAVGALIIVGALIPFITGSMGGNHDLALVLLLVNTAVAGLLGIHLVMAIGGADMPVVVSLLNSYSGWAAAAAGFMLSNDLLIVTGALVGSSGAILSIIMCRAMNRSIWNVIFGGFGATAGKAPSAAAQEQQGEVTSVEADQVAEALMEAKSVIIVPGYGMAVARAQHLVWDMTKILRKKNIKVRYAIHPVAGRLPGHMNVLLAEAGVPYDIVEEMDEINGDMPSTDVVLVIGANDIVNPGAETDESSAIYGMPVLQVWKAGTVVVFKRSMAAGYAGVENPLFFHENTWMLFGDAGDRVKALVSALSAG